MVKGSLETRRVLINDYSEGLEIIIPPRKNPFVSGFLTTWLLAWIYGEIVIIDKIVNQAEGGADAFIVLWLCAWTFGGLVAVLLQSWNLKGREIIKIDEDELWLSREYVWFARSRHYQLRHIRNMRLTEINMSRPDLYQGAEFWGLSGGAVSFDYGESIQRIALGIDEMDAGEIIETIKARYPDV